MFSSYCGVAHLHFSLKVNEFFPLKAYTDFRRHSPEQLTWLFNDCQTGCLRHYQVSLRYLPVLSLNLCRKGFSGYLRNNLRLFSWIDSIFRFLEVLPYFLYAFTYFSDWLESISFNSLKVCFVGSASCLYTHIPTAFPPRNACPAMFRWPAGSTS